MTDALDFLRTERAKLSEELRALQARIEDFDLAIGCLSAKTTEPAPEAGAEQPEPAKPDLSDPAARRAAVLKLDARGLNRNEIAPMLGLHPMSVSSILMHARHRSEAKKRDAEGRAAAVVSKSPAASPPTGAFEDDPRAGHEHDPAPAPRDVTADLMGDPVPGRSAA